jgi:S-DNA-T family DNA segregation ATPase FtsK/SpoIIIE
VPIGLSERTMTTEYLDLAGGDPHFLVFGDSESGKSTFLTTLLHGICTRAAPETAVVYVIDYRRSLLEVVPSPFLRAYLASAKAAQDAFTELRAELEQRLPDVDVTAAELKARSWWHGPEVYVVVDDYDMVATPAGTPLAPLIDLFAQGRDIGLHMVIARRVAGAAGAAFEPATKRIKEVSPAGLILSGDRGEGQLLGPNRPGPQPAGRGILVRPRSSTSLIQIARDVEV